MKTFLKSTLIFGIIIFLIVGAIVSFTDTTLQDAVWLIVMIILGGIVGPFMAIGFPFSVLFKVYYSLGLIATCAGIVVGIMRRKHIWGKCLLIAGVLIWLGLGLIGLGTGT